jgi:multiple sugar transport system substrate-binding protein
MRKSLLKLLSLLAIAMVVLAACTSAPEATEAPAEEAPAEEAPAEEAPAEEAPAEEAPAEEAPAEEAPAEEAVQIRWFVGLGTGTNPEQIEVQEEVVADFNAANPGIELVLEIVPFDSAKDTLATQIASGAGPDIIGPVGWGGSNAFAGQFLDVQPLIDSTGFDTSIFPSALVDSYNTSNGQVGLPFAVFPAATFYVPSMFDEVGLEYPPQGYDDNSYVLDGETVEWDWDTLVEVARRMTLDVNGFNSTEEGFDATQIVQVGFQFQWQTGFSNVGTYRDGAAWMWAGEEGSYEATLPDGWKSAMEWIYDGMWGPQPFTATGALAGSPEFGASNVFNAGKSAMSITPLWYTCCLGDFAAAGGEFQVGNLPLGDDGEHHGRVDADTFRVWKGTANPEEAFTVLTYLLTDGADKLLPIYGAMPSIEDKIEPFFAAKSADFPFVTETSWEVFKASLAYADSPSAEQPQPNWNEAFARQQTFFDLLMNTAPEDLDFEGEWQALIDDLNVIYNK